MIEIDSLKPGDEIIAAAFGPLTIADTVRWAGVQENWEPVHWDRDFVREKSRLRTFIASGTYRQALLIRALTDWLGPHGTVKTLSIRHLAPTFEGDMQNYTARVSAIAKDGDNALVTCELAGFNQNQEKMLVGTCVLRLAARSGSPE